MGNWLKGRPSQGVKGHKLTPKMISFINEYMIDGNLTEAFARSLYNTKTLNRATITRTALELMEHPLVAEEIAKRMAAKQKKSEVTAEYLLSKLLEVIENTDDEKTVDRLRAIELAGKSFGFWKERQEVSGPDGEAIKHEQHIKESVADLTSRIASLAERRGTTNVVEFPNGRAES